MPEEEGAQRTGDHHFACTLSSVLVRRIRRTMGEEGLMELLARSGSTRTVAYLDDLTNSGKGEVAELLRPFYLDYLKQHGVEAP